LESDHLSAYALIVEQGTALERRIRRGDLAGVDDDLQADMYELLTDLTGAAGMTWYEISNWSRTSESIHNLAYWRSQDWWGFGPGAHSHLAGVRWWNHKHPTRYLAALNVGSPAAGLERLTQAQRLDEQIMLGLRTRYGVAEVLLTNRGVDSTLIEQLVSEGQLERTDGSLRATVAGRLRADGIALDLISSAID
jgi:oxygen-independent coproporphyrinogen-3 oxidase